MRSSNTCHNRARNSFGSAWLPALAIATCFSPVLRGLDPNDSISRYIHDQWSEEDGFPGGTVNAITQTRDGYLWIGGEGGLVRFDGNVFTRIGSVAEPVLGLIADHEGALWIRTEAGGLIRYSGGTLKRDFFATGPNPVVTAMGLGRQGTPLLVRFGEPVRFEGGKLIDLWPRPVDATTRLTTSTAETPDGTVWMGSRDSGLFALRGTVLSPLGGLPDSKVNCLLAGPGSELWVGTDKGLVLWNGQKLTRSVPPSVQHAEILALARDRDANVWVGTSTGLVRIDSRNVAADDGARGGVNAVFEDREGNLWIGRGGGIERYRESVFLTYAHQPHAADNGPLYVDASGRAWFAPPEGGLAWLTGLDQGIVTQAGLDKDVVYSMDGGPGEVWAGRQRGGLTELRVKNGVFAVRTYTQADGLARGSVFAVRRTRNGTIWAGTLDGGVSRLRNGRLTTYTRSDGLLSDTVYAIEEGADGTVWFATPNGLESFANDRWQTHAFAEGLPPGRVNCLTWDPAGVLWIGTEAGVAFVRDGRMQMARNPPVSLIADVLGIAVDERAYLWIATNKSVMRVPRGRLLGQRAATDEIQEFSHVDGIPSSAGVRRSRSVVTGPLGRIWFSLHSGISVVNPARVAAGSAPAIMLIRGAAADGRLLDPSRPLRIPAGRQRITIDYVGLSLSVPSRVQYRYRLDGFDHTWSEPTTTRQAVYTNLQPASYRFRVIASNSEGVWNSSEAAVSIEIVPAFWQTQWFKFAAVAGCGLMVIAVYQLRLRRVTTRLNLRFEERLAERTRIAQDLHDTLLQGFLSASMQVHAATDRLPDDSAVKPALTRAVQLMRQVIQEGRNTLRGLRSRDPGSADLARAFLQVPQELGSEETSGKGAAFRVIVDGQQQPLRPLLRDEAYRIGREALINAFRHSHANHIEIELNYTSGRFRVFVRDDGSGIDPKTLQTGRDGHWGLSGMSERAERIGARLHVLSRASAGTEVELDVPGKVAFEVRPGLIGWLNKRLGRNGKNDD